MTGHALVTSPEDHTVVGIEPVLCRDGLHQSLFHCQPAGISGDYSEPVGDPIDVGVNGKGGDVEALCQHDISHLPADSGQARQFF